LKFIIIIRKFWPKLVHKIDPRAAAKSAVRAEFEAVKREQMEEVGLGYSQSQPPNVAQFINIKTTALHPGGIRSHDP
jgi:hypothetical protein